MQKTISPSEMKRVEMDVMVRTSITGEMLMQRAAAHVADAAEKYGSRVLCLCGTGNNGGDGMAAMRILAQRYDNFQGECWILPGKLSADAVRELDRLQKTSVVIRYLEDEVPAKKGFDCIIDALFGTGLCRPLEGLAKKCCEWMNQQNTPIVAVDIPSGLSGLTGDVLGAAVQADVTVTFHRPKHGLYLKDGPDYAGEIVVGDIGIPAEYDDAEGFELLEPQDISRFLPKRRRVSHKGSYGRVLLLAGSRGMAGAAAIAATAALRTGAGLVTVACPYRVVDIVQVLCPCATCLPLPEDADEAWALLESAIDRCDALGAGCGMGQSAWAAELIRRVSQLDKPMVLDADALNLMAKNGLSAPGAFITPHPAEAARLLGCNIPSILADAPRAARRLAQTYCTVLKGTCSVMDDGVRQALNPYGTPGMAKGGSGDALMGIMTALLAGRGAGAYAMTDLELMQTACALHGLAGEKAAQQHGERGMLATDLCAYLGENPNIPAEKEMENSPVLGRQVMVVVEHPAKSRDEHKRFYPLNLGYVQQVLEAENRWQDALVVGIDEPIEYFEGTVLAVTQDLWLVGPENLRLSDAEISRLAASVPKEMA